MWENENENENEKEVQEDETPYNQHALADEPEKEDKHAPPQSPPRQIQVSSPSSPLEDSVNQPKVNAPPSVIVGTVQKRNVSSKLGITFASIRGRLMIHKVKGKFEQQTDLVPGLQIYQVNGWNATSAKQAATILRRASAGPVTVSVYGYVVHAKKQRKKDRAGISLQQTISVPRIIRIARVDPTGLFPTLKVGQYLMAVNGRPLDSVQDAIKSLMKKRKLTLVLIDPPTQQQQVEAEQAAATAQNEDDELDADNSDDKLIDEGENKADDDDDDDDYSVDPDDDKSCASDDFSKSDGYSVGSSSNWSSASGWNEDDMSVFEGMLAPSDVEGFDSQLLFSPTTRVIASFIRPPGTKCGLGFQVQDGQIVVNNVDPQGLFAQSGIDLGQRLVCVNGIEITTIQQALECFQTSAGRITVETLLVGQSEEAIRVALQFEKPEKSTKLGLALKRSNARGGIHITGISDQGLFAHGNIPNSLEKEFTITGINGQAAPKATRDLVAQLQATFPIVSLECLLPDAAKQLALIQQKQKQEQQGLQPQESSQPQEELQQQPELPKSNKLPEHIYTSVLGDLVTVEVEKPANAKAGVALRKSLKINSILIAGLSEGGLLHKSDLKVGQKIVSINGVECPSATVEVIKMIGNTTGKLVIVAAEVDWGATLSASPATRLAAAPAPVPAIPTEVNMTIPKEVNTIAAPANANSKDGDISATVSDGQINKEDQPTNLPVKAKTVMSLGQGFMSPGAGEDSFVKITQDLQDLIGNFEQDLQNIYNQADDEDKSMDGSECDDDMLTGNLDNFIDK